MTAWVVPLFPILAAPAVALAAWGLGDGSGEGGTGRRLLAALAVGVMLATATLAGLASAGGWTGELAWSGDLLLRLDFGLNSAPASALVALLVPTVAAPVVGFAAAHEDLRGLARLITILVFFVGGMELVAGAADLLTLLVGWELIGACSAVLVSHEWRDAENPRAGMAVFLATRSGDLGLFLAVAVSFAAVGSPGYEALAGLEGTALDLVAAGVLAAAAAKSAQLPFAPWLFSAMKGPVSVSSLLHAATMVAAGAFLLVRLHGALAPAGWFGPAAAGIGLATALAGGIVAVVEPHAKRLLAASTSAHYGLMFVAAGAGYPAVALLHLAAHAFAKAALFLATGVARAVRGSYRLASLGLRRSLPVVALATGLAAAAIAGVPPLGAAWTKEGVVAAAGHMVPWLAAAGAVAGGLSAAYMARFHAQSFGLRAEGPERRKPRTGERWTLYALVAATVLLGVLWLPRVHDAAARGLGMELPSSKPWELALSLGLAGAGLAAGWYVARTRPRLGSRGAAEAVSGWFGLPRLARLLVVRPSRRLSAALARVDDGAVDAGVRAVSRLAGGLSRRLSGVDSRVVDAAVRAASRFADALSRRLSGVDGRVVDAAVVAGAALVDRVADLGRSLGEAVFDGIPGGIADLTAEAGRRARELQSGLAHRYYSLIVSGLAAAMILMILGG